MKHSSIGIRKFKYMIGIKKEIHIEGIIPVFTDGSCLNNGKSNAVSSIGVYFPTNTNLYKFN